MHILFVTAVTSPASDTVHHLQGREDITVNYFNNLESVDNSETIADIVLFDAQLGENKIKQQINVYKQLNIQLHWLVINMDKNIQQAIKYLQAGASGILNSPCNQKHLGDLITTVNNKKLYLDQDLQQTLALRQINKTLEPFSLLTSREFDVFCLLAEKFSIDYIADDLKISTKTAFNCQSQIRKKLRLKNQQQITQFAKRHSLIL